VQVRLEQELLQRIRDIRSSERNFYQKITDVYATSVDYLKNAKSTKDFFATVQNKMHFTLGKYITTQDINIAKNYLTEK